MRLGILGPIEVTNDDGVALPLGPPMQRALLAALAMRPNRVVRAERLVDTLWHDGPPASALNLVQGYVSKLRRLVGDERLVYRDGGYVLVVVDDELDAARFERLASEGRSTLRDDPAAAAQIFGDALGLWRGTPLGELPDAMDARAEAARLEEQYLGILEDSFDAGLSAGRHISLTADLEAAVRLHPLRERLRALQMTALYRSGRQADALAAYQDARRVLADELGLDPGPELRALEQAILVHDPSLIADGQQPRRPAHPPSRVPDDLPVDTTLIDPRVGVRMFGALELSAGSVRIGPRELGGVKPKQVFEVLLLERGRPVPKERLIELIWGSSLPQNVAATLENHVSVLRRHLAALGVDGRRVLVTDAGAYRLAAEHFDVDLDRFDDLRAGEDAASPAVRRARLEEALKLAVGPVLADEPYADWALRLRDDYAEFEARARLDAAAACLALRDLPAALTHAEAVLRTDRAREAAHRVAVLALYAMGRQDEALRAYDRCREALTDELGVDPLPETASLQLAILRHEDAASLLDATVTATRPVVTIQPSVAATTPTIPLLGRVAELAALRERLQLALAGEASLVLLKGEAGVGKTKLIDETLAGLTGAAVGRAKCFELERGIPYVPLAEALRAVLVGTSSQYRQLPALGEILPELGASGLAPEAARARALASVAECLHALGPTVLVIDDLQWADPSTITAMSYLRRHLTAPVLLVGAYRPEAADMTHPLRLLTPDLHIEVGSLTEQELAPLGDSTLFARTGGHPLFVVELVGAREQGSQVPDTLTEAIQNHCRSTGPAAHRLLTTASVVGRTFDIAVLADLLNEDPVVLAEVADALCERRLLRPRGTGFDFRHDLIREVLYAGLAAGRRLVLHRRVLQVLEARGADVGQLAVHADAAGAAEAAIRYYGLAAAGASRGWALTESQRSFARALALADEHLDAIEAEVVESLLVGLSHTLTDLGRPIEAEPLAQRARRSAGERGDALAELAALEALCYSLHACGDVQGFEAAAREAVSVAAKGGERASLARAHAALAHALLAEGHFVESEQVAQRADDNPLALYALGAANHFRGRIPDALAWFERAEAAAVQSNDDVVRMRVILLRSLTLIAAGQYQLAWNELMTLQDATAEEIPYHSRLPNCFGGILSDLGLFAQARDRNLEAAELAGAPSGHIAIEARFNLVIDNLGLDDLAAARSELERIRDSAQQQETTRFRRLPRLAWLDSMLLLEEGRPEDAIAAAARAFQQAQQGDVPKYVIRAQLADAEARLVLGERDHAARLARRAARDAAARGIIPLAWRGWWLAHRAGGHSDDLRQAQDAVVVIADRLDEPLRQQFLSAVPVPP